MAIRYPRITDDDRDTITATMDGEPVRSWIYLTDGERRTKMKMAHEFAEGWFQCSMHMKAHDGQFHMIGEFDE